MTDQPPRAPQDEKNRPIGPPQSMSGKDLSAEEELTGSKSGEIRGDGASDHYRDAGSGSEEVKGEDVEKFGIKPDDAMGAGG